MSTLETRAAFSRRWARARRLTCKGRNVTLWVNGAVTNQWKACGVPRGYAGLEAEGWRVEFRNSRSSYSELPWFGNR